MPTYDPGTPDLSTDAIPLKAVRYDPGQDTYETLNNIRCLGVQWFEGSKPPAARFEYVFDDHDPDSPYPTQFEQVWPLSATDANAVQCDDELLVLGQKPDGNWRLLWDGFAQIPQVDVQPRGQAVTFTAVGTPIRCSDKTIGGAHYRQGYQPLSGDEVATDLTSRFNPDRHGNCTAVGYDVNQGSTDPAKPPYPLFLDWQLDTASKTLWTLGMFARYILAKYNDQTWVDNPDFGDLDELLENRQSKDGAFVDPNDPSTYTSKPIIIRDVVADGKLWPDLLEQVLRYHGFAYRWVLTADTDDPDGDEDGYPPVWTIEVYRLDTGNGTAAKAVTLPPTGGRLDQDWANLGSLSVVRDHNGVFNAVSIETDPNLYEVDFYLVALFQYASTDGTDATRENWNKANLDTETEGTLAKYRWYGIDECAEGHTNYDTGAWDTTDAFSFDAILGKPDAAGKAQWVTRRRPGRNTLNTLDDQTHPCEAVLSISTAFAPGLGAVPGPWDGTLPGLWQPVQNWRPLKDRFGVELICDTPEAWHAGKGPVVGESGVINIIGAQNGITPHVEFLLKYTTVIEGDKGLVAAVPKSLASPGRFTVWRRLDARDHFCKQVIQGGTEYNEDPGNTFSIRDDTAAALAHAGAVQANHHFPKLAGTVTVPWLTNSYQIGDRLATVAGRDVSLRTNIGSTEEGPRYPVVCAIHWDLGGGGQKTVLQLDDRRAEVQAITRSATLDV